MAIDLGCIGQRVAPVVKHYDWRDVALYALALGAGEHDLPFVLNPAPKVLPTYGVIPAIEPMFAAAHKTGANLVQLLHTAQRTELVRPWPAEGEMQTNATVRGIWDMKVGALLIVDTETAV